MITKELENKLKISKNTCIHCSTLELAKQVLSIFHQLGLKWCNETHYTLNHNWDSFKENTVYYPFEGEFTSLSYARLRDYKIINAEEFITLHTEKEEFDLENYVPKGQLTGFPKEIIARMLECQKEQGNEKDISVFERDREANNRKKGFDWRKTQEEQDFWFRVIGHRIFNVFFKKYPKKQDNQEFRVGDKVIDIINGRRGKVIHILSEIKGKVIDINTLNKDNSIFVDLDDNDRTGFTLDGRYYSTDKYPRLLHYRDDYDYSVIDFNNLPKRQEFKRWRAMKREVYYFVSHYFTSVKSRDYRINNDNEAYKIGNYFKTKEEAQEVADKLKEDFKQLIQKRTCKQ